MRPFLEPTDEAFTDLERRPDELAEDGKFYYISFRMDMVPFVEALAREKLPGVRIRGSGELFVDDETLLPHRLVVACGSCLVPIGDDFDLTAEFTFFGFNELVNIPSPEEEPILLPPRASEEATVQLAMEAMMAERGITSIAPSVTAVNDWTNNPLGSGAEPLDGYLATTPTTWFYCYGASGRITLQSEGPARCPRPPAPAVAAAAAPTRAPVQVATAAPAATAVPTAPIAGLPRVFPVDPRTVVPAGVDLHDRQWITVPNGHRGVAPWRDGGGQRIFSMWVYGTVYLIDKFGVIRPYIGISHEVSSDDTVWTVKLRQDAIFQDGTPITAKDIKAYWEHGAKPENIVAWGGASLSLGDIKGWEELRAGDVTEADGLVAVDDHTLQITTSIPFPTWPLSIPHLASFDGRLAHGHLEA